MEGETLRLMAITAGPLKRALGHLALQLEEADVLMQQAAREKETCKRLAAIPGIGPLTAPALRARRAGLRQKPYPFA